MILNSDDSMQQDCKMITNISFEKIFYLNAFRFVLLQKRSVASRYRCIWEPCGPQRRYTQGTQRGAGRRLGQYKFQPQTVFFTYIWSTYELKTDGESLYGKASLAHMVFLGILLGKSVSIWHFLDGKLFYTTGAAFFFRCNTKVS